MPHFRKYRVATQFCILQSFTVKLNDDNVSEQEEIFEIRLITARSDDNVLGSTVVSGASIDPNKSTSRLVIPKKDYL